MNKIKLFAFPFAGASSMYYFKWKKHLNDYIDFVPIELAGRGTRQKTSFYKDFAEAVEDTYDQIENGIDDCSYAFFGHSLGSLLSYELAYALKKRNRRMPVVIFVSGRWPPHIVRENFVDHRTPDARLKERLLELGGATPELFENKYLADMFIPIIRADFKLMESYVYDEHREPLSSYINVLTGMQDWDVNKRDLFEWSQHTIGEFSLHKFKGGHFFINDSFEMVIQHINRVLRDKV